MEVTFWVNSKCVNDGRARIRPWNHLLYANRSLVPWSNRTWDAEKVNINQQYSFSIVCKYSFLAPIISV
jgi:hypothetical protein